MASKFDSLVGQVVDKRYKILSVIGEGGMSIVFKARDLTTDRNVAIKVLNEANDPDGQAVKRFLNESRAISMLSHENIVKIYDVSVSREPKYIVMEHVDGDTLKGYMDKRGKKLSLEEALDFTEQILMALEHAHSKKVIHRDIKPHNIMVLKNGFIKVTDFGIAKTPNSDTISMNDKALGTVYYISPEQISCRETGTYSDIYSVGVMLYEMSTGKLPFDSDNLVNVAMQQIKEEPIPPCDICPELPRGLQQIILKAMSKNPEDRFKSAHSMLRAVKILKEDHGVVFDEGAASTPAMKKKPVSKKSLKNGVFGGIIKFFERFSGNDNDKKTASAEEDKNTRVTFFPIILGIASAFFLTLLVAGIVIISGIIKTTNASAKDTKYITVPELVGKAYSEDLKDDLEKESFSVKVEWAEKHNDAYGYGEIYSTEPEGNTTKKVRGSLGQVELVLYVNPEEGSSLFPDYSIRQVNSVKTELSNLGYKNVEVVRENHNTVLENYVFRTEPEAGVPVKPTDKITIYVSSGKSLKNVISMPDLVGKTKGEAAVALEKFNVEYVTVADSADVGTVIWQSVDAHTVISPDFCDAIRIFVSDGTLAESDTFYLVMPDLKNKSLSEAEMLMREIASYGIKIDYQEQWESLPAGTVYYQSIEAGATVLVNHSKPIKIFYSNGNKPAQNTEVTEEEPADAVETEN